jgi:hypothetical protein
MMRILASVAMIALFVTAPIAQDARAQTVEAGTYRLIICAEPCTASDTARSVATAVVVILDAGDQAMRAVWNALPLRPIDPQQPAFGQSACFKVTKAARKVGAEELNFGITTSALTYAVASAGSTNAAFSMIVYRSIDAAYELRWSGGGPLVRGEGWSLSPDIRTSFHRNAYFAAERTGGPDPAQCK